MAESSAPSPIFIVGANRSGTTLLRLLLNAYSRIAIPDELIYLDSHLGGAPIEQWRDPALSPEEYEAFVDRFLDDNCQPLTELDHAALKAEILAGRPDLRRPYRLALEDWAHHHGKDRWGEKTPGNLFYADVLLDMFPEAQFLYVVRDPRAGVASMQKVSFFPDDIVFNALSRRKHDTEGRALLELAPADDRSLRGAGPRARIDDAINLSLSRRGVRAADAPLPRECGAVHDRGRPAAPQRDGHSSHHGRSR